MTQIEETFFLRTYTLGLRDTPVCFYEVKLGSFTKGFSGSQTIFMALTK